MARARTGDFDSYLLDAAIVSARIDARWVSVVWEDGRESRFHHVWLRDNCPCEACVAEVTREQTFELIAVPAGDLVPESVAWSPSSLALTWTGGHPSVYDAGWLRAHDYSTGPVHGRGPARVLWDSSLGAPPAFDGAAIHAGDDDELFAWLTALETHGCSLLHGVPCTETAVGEVAARIGIVRETNFGVLWDVKVDDDPVSNANTALPLPLHTDLPTREYQPGLQFLHCLVNEAVGGESILVDGFRLAEELRRRDASAFDVLTRVPWDWANRSKVTDYRWVSPVFVIDAAGQLSEVRLGNWLRAPLTSAPFDDVEAAYAAYRVLFEMTVDPSFQIRFRLGEGDLMAFDNRRVLHARGAFDRVGRRLLRGCYSERDELRSRLRMLARARRAAQLHA